MQQLVVVVAVAVVLLQACEVGSTGVGKGEPLRFDKTTGAFRIVQFTDQHFGEGEDVAWGRQQDVNSTRVMNAVLAHERPDLVVYTGDQLTGNNIHHNATTYWSEVIAPSLHANLKWAFVFGNHDDMPLQPSSEQRSHTSPAGLASPVRSDTSRAQLLSFDNSFPGSTTRDENPALPGVTNFHLRVKHNHDNLTTPLFFFDSGGGTIPEVVHEAQVDWYRSLSISGVGVAFMHIPLPQYTSAHQPGNACFGMANDDVSPQERDTGLFDAFLEQQNVRAVFVGHNHGNDWCCRSSSIWLCFGRHSGYGGYGRWRRGARVIVLRENSTVIETYIRMEDGSTMHHGTL